MNTLKDLRVKAGLTQKTLAEKLGVSRVTVTNWEAKRARPNANQIKALSAALRCSADKLVNAIVD